MVLLAANISAGDLHSLHRLCPTKRYLLWLPIATLLHASRNAILPLGQLIYAFTFGKADGIGFDRMHHCSVWTVDLAHLLRSFGLEVTYKTLTLGTNPGFRGEAFYDKMHEDAVRVHQLFQVLLLHCKCYPLVV